MSKKLERAVYDAKYTLGSYADALMSVPIGIGEGFSKLSQKVLRDKTPKSLNLNHIRENSPIYQTRKKLRDSLDTEPGMKYLQSNIVAVLPFVLAGIPAAEGAEKLIDAYIPNVPPLAKDGLNSVATLLAQGATGYTGYMFNEVRTNPQKYMGENGKIKPKKVWDGFVKSVKAFVSFDAPYALGKIGGQTAFLAMGKDPWKATTLFDGLALPTWYAIAIPLGLHKGLIETKETRHWQEESAQTE